MRQLALHTLQWAWAIAGTDGSIEIEAGTDGSAALLRVDASGNGGETGPGLGLLTAGALARAAAARSTHPRRAGCSSGSRSPRPLRESRAPIRRHPRWRPQAIGVTMAVLHVEHDREWHPPRTPARVLLPRVRPRVMRRRPGEGMET